MHICPVVRECTDNKRLPNVGHYGGNFKVYHAARMFYYYGNVYVDDIVNNYDFGWIEE